jgi:hypothetical protein
MYYFYVIKIKLPFNNSISILFKGKLITQIFIYFKKQKNH